MKKFSHHIISPFAFGTIVYLFFTLLYPYHLHYQEQYQLFLFTGDYFQSYLNIPGGMSDYIGNFLTQFYFYPSVGAIFIAFLLVLIQQLTWKTVKNTEKSSVYFPLTFIPSILYWALLCDENYLPGGLISLVFLMVFISIRITIKSENLKSIFAVLSIPVLYWIAGGAVVFYVLYSVLAILFIRKERTARNTIITFIQVGLAISLPFIAKAILIQHPIIKMWIGVNFYSFPNTFPFYAGGVFLLSVLLPFFIKSLMIIRFHFKWAITVLYVVIIIAGFVTIKTSSVFDKEEVMAYDFHTRMRQWDKVIAMADKKSPSSPLSVSCLNLALAKKGMLAEHMFEYYQNGTGGLLPDFKKDFTIPMVTGEIYYQLGFINTAQRYTFEAMEALPLYQKSARTMKRLAETNLINGNRALTLKYLKILQKTLFYSKWATALSKVIDDQEILLQHPEYGWLMTHKIQNDFFFSEGEKDMMLGQLFTANNKNRTAYEYLMAYCLLNKDLNHFMQYLSLAQTIGYKQMPISFQEAFIYSWKMTSQKAPKSMPSFISNEKIQSANAFLSKMNLPNASEVLKKDYGKTYWYYLQFRN
ncbi:DUF6057 family protein [Carboxylicivirga caseinilyticus]|uniref:DUF6057 family protein n=1 Tax=Carboxylicivirga caseinilyticus TaxID=3417572 RepID=UPI003D332DC1|nr:hypothetical protein [Marinilabiliaceae bacterium A049]